MDNLYNKSENELKNKKSIQKLNEENLENISGGYIFPTFKEEVSYYLNMRTCDFCGRSGVESVTYSIGGSDYTTIHDTPETKGKLRIYNVGIECISRDVCPDCFYEMYRKDITKMF